LLIGSIDNLDDRTAKPYVWSLDTVVTTMKRQSDVDWALLAGIVFWALTIAGLIAIINAGRVNIPQPVLDVATVSAESAQVILVHRGGDPVWFANTRCKWTPDITLPAGTEEAGTLILLGSENHQGRISKLEPGEKAGFAKAVSLRPGRVGRVVIEDLKSGRMIFSRVVYVYP